MNPFTLKIAEWVGAAALPLIVCVVIAFHFYGAGHADAVLTLQPKIDSLTQTVQIDDDTIKQMQLDAATNEKLLGEYQHEIDTLNQQTIVQQNDIHRLQSDDKDVDAYLRAPIPDALRSLLNHEPAVAPASSQDPVPAAPEVTGFDLPTVTRRIFGHHG